jgi:Fe-S oxidoreductase
MQLADYSKEINGCFRCSECKIGYRSQMPICPSGAHFEFNSYYAAGRLDIAGALIEGTVEATEPSLADPVFSCLSCGACEAKCYPQMAINTTEIFRAMKAELVDSGNEPPPLFAAVLEALRDTNNYYGQDPSRRMDWAEGLDVKKADADTELLFFVGCYGAFDPVTLFTARATANLLNKSGVNWGVLDDEEFCCGLPVLDVGYRDEFTRLASHNIRKINASGVKTLITSCASCFGTMQKDWPHAEKLGFDVVHSSQFLLEAIREGNLTVNGAMEKTVTLHDPCHLGRLGGDVYAEPRELLQSIPGVVLHEMERNRDEAFCCGAGGQCNSCFPDMALGTATARLEEAANTGVDAMVIPSCPICYNNFSTVPPGERGVDLIDLTQMVDEFCIGAEHHA